jgi:putative nucleotidyltransferase with HDIG domain
MSINNSAAVRIPSREECHDLMDRYSMLPNILAHSNQVMRVSLAITDNLTSGAAVNRNMVIAAALLHDITKTRSLQTKEPHDSSGGLLLRELGYPCIAEIIEQHVFFEGLNPHGNIEDREIIYYADKRVMHDKIVSVDERLRDLVKRYGSTEMIRNRILRNRELILAIEHKIARFMKVDLHTAIEGLQKTSG